MEDESVQHPCGFNRAIRPGSRRLCPTLTPAPVHPGLHNDCSYPSSFWTSRCVGCCSQGVSWEWEQRRLQIWRWIFGWCWLWEGGCARPEARWAAAGRACFSSGCPGGSSSSGSALLAAVSSAVVASSPESPPEVSQGKQTGCQSAGQTHKTWSRTGNTRGIKKWTAKLSTPGLVKNMKD